MPSIRRRSSRFVQLPKPSALLTALRSYKNQLYAMVTDTAINSVATVLSTLYLRFMETAMKLYRYAKSMPSRTDVNSSLLISESSCSPGPDPFCMRGANPNDETETIDDLVDIGFLVVKSKERNPSIKDYRCAVSKAQVQW
jgi:hypothetical protein